MARPSEPFRCAFCTRVVQLSKDGKSVLRHINVSGFCGGSYHTVAEHKAVLEKAHGSEPGPVSKVRVVRK